MSSGPHLDLSRICDYTAPGRHHLDDATRNEFLSIIDEEADRLSELIDNLLDSSRLQSGTLHMEFQPLRLDTMLRDIPIRARSFDESLMIKVEFQTTDILIQADPTRLAQVFDNLLSNAANMHLDQM